MKEGNRGFNCGGVIRTSHGAFSVAEYRLWEIARFGLTMLPGLFFMTQYDIVAVVCLIAAVMADRFVPIARWLRSDTHWYRTLFWGELMAWLVAGVLLRPSTEHDWGLMIWMLIVFTYIFVYSLGKRKREAVLFRQNTGTDLFK